jgi:glycosyltransferase involved in cell wall biosynthesis
VEQSMLAPAVHDARVIPNGVDLTVFQPADKRCARERLGVGPDDIVILFVANRIRDNRWKDFETIRKSIAKLSDENLSSRIVFLALGETGEQERVGNVKIQFMPYESDPAAVARCFQASDVYVHAAHADTFPSTIMEAMACGTPVVATAVGGIAEQIVDGKSGFLVPAQGSDAMTRHIENLIADSSLRERVGTEARRFAECHFNLRRQVDCYLQWYSQLLGDPAQCRY